MIAYLHGTPKILGTALIVITQGVGYEVLVGESTLHKASQLESIELYIHTHVREDALQLFGFSSPTEKIMFELLLTVSGVGPKTALVIAENAPQSVSKAVQEADTAFFTQFPRVGKKLAQKIIIELRSKLGSIRDLDLGPVSKQTADITDALLGLGYGEKEISDALRLISVDEMSVQEALKQAMKVMSKG